MRSKKALSLRVPRLRLLQPGSFSSKPHTLRLAQFLQRSESLRSFAGDTAALPSNISVRVSVDFFSA